MKLSISVSILYVIIVVSNDLIATAKHHWSNHHHQHHHQNHPHISNYFPFDSNINRNLHRNLLMGLHNFEHTDDIKLPDSNAYIEMIEKDLEQHHKIRHQAKSIHNKDGDIHWPVKKEAEVDGDIVLGGLMMVHEREDSITCGPIMPQGGIQALEAMLYTLDRINADPAILPNITLGAHILDDCDKDTYGLEIAVDFIKGKRNTNVYTLFYFRFILFTF